MNRTERRYVVRGMRSAVVDACRGLAAAAVLLSAVVHLDLYWLEGFASIATIGPLFLLNGIGGIVLGAIVTSWRHWLPALGAAGFGIVTVVFFWISVVHGLFGLKEQAGGAAEVLAEVAEYAAALFGLITAAGLWRERRAATSPAPRRSAPSAAAVHVR
jgi:hypothetical protein